MNVVCDALSRTTAGQRRWPVGSVVRTRRGGWRTTWQLLLLKTDLAS